MWRVENGERFTVEEELLSGGPDGQAVGLRMHGMLCDRRWKLSSRAIGQA